MTIFLLLLVTYVAVSVELWRGSYCGCCKKWHREPQSLEEAFKWPVRIFRK